MPTRRRRPALRTRFAPLLALGCLLVACDALGDAAATAREAFAQAGRLEWRPCWFDVESLADGRQARCATFHVPERWGDAAAPALRLPVVVASASPPTRAGVRLRDAVLIPGGGGPGGSVGLESDQAADTLARKGFLSDASGRDVVLIDQRGAGLADPALHCEELEAAMLRHLALALPAADETALWGDAAGRCARRIESLGFTPAAFDTRSAARDLEALRKALGYSQWNLYGTSYGARLSLAFARDFPVSVRSLVLESPSALDAEVAEGPANFERVLRALFERCQRDPQCRRDYPDPAGALDRVLSRLEVRPLRVEASHPRTLEPVPVLVTPVRLLDAIHAALYSTSAAHDLPRVLSAADRGSFDLVSGVVQDYVRTQLDPRFAVGLLEVITCRELVPYGDLARLEREAARHSWRRGFLSSSAIARAQCAAWRVGEAGAAAHEALVFAGPALILAGRLDPAIPIESVRRLASRLPGSRLLELPATGHDAGHAWWGCAEALVGAFLLDPALHSEPQPEDESCRQRAEGMRFPSLRPREVLPTP